MMDSDLPAGYFSTFSIIDLSRGTLEGLGRPQRRNRRIFVCIPCHRRKLKCDKGQPCARCIQSGSADECVYQQYPPGSRRDSSTDSGKTSQRSVQPSQHSTPVAVVSEREPRLNGVTHWRTIAFEFREGWPYISGTDPEWEPTYRQIQGHKYIFASLSGFNFPFGDITSSNRSRDHVTQCLPRRHVVDILIRSYFAAVEPIYRLFHPQQFEEELNTFWIDSSQCTNDIGRPPEGLSDRFLHAAQFFLGRSPYLSAPTLASVRTMCLAVIAQMLGIVKGTEMSQLLSVMGFLSRSAMTLQLHRSPSLFPGLTQFDAEMRKRVWATVQLLDLEVAMGTGTSYMHSDHEIITPSNINNADVYHTELGWMMNRVRGAEKEITDSSFQVELAKMLPILVNVINAANSPTQPPPTYDKVQAWDSHLCQKLFEAESALTPDPSVQLDRVETAKTQLDFLRVLIHRARLAIHHHYISDSSFQRFSDSTAAVLQSSLNILRIQQTWRHRQPIDSLPAAATPTATLPPRPPPQTSPRSTTWLLDLHRDSFTAALLYYMLSQRRLHLGLIPPERQHEQQHYQPQLIQQSLEIFRSRAGRSAAHYEDFATLFIAAGVLQGLNTTTAARATQERVIRVLMEVAEQIEGTALASAATAAATATAGSGDSNNEQGASGVLWTDMGVASGSSGIGAGEGGGYVFTVAEQMAGFAAPGGYGFGAGPP
ncbi:Oleate activated transcription factor 3 [Madurella mycetomatis]|uniref:Oleate activated transcription factor 3 n=1 Tax=Madurella mycetomatis TaxID=100816 RepID=A0A175WIN9_9PEZI|nr:Oleate activated transcription factor 3 [Madurella mycetomatis]